MTMGNHSARTLTRGQKTLAGVIVLLALGLAAYAAAASYDTVSAQAASRGVSLPRLNPLGIDGGLFGIIVMDIALTWTGHPIWWLRMAARLFAAGTVAANASAGWPDPVGTGLRVAAPLLFVLIVEAARTLLLRSRHAAERERRRADRIPPVRWLLDFRGTFAMWKRMRLWGEPSYANAVSMELDRLAAIGKLGMKYGNAWQEKAPADLAWMLAAGVRMPEALARVAELTAPERAPEPASAPAEVPSRKRESATGNLRARKAAAGTRKTAPSARPQAPAVDPADLPGNWDELDTEARVLFLVNEKSYSGSAAGIAAGVSDARGRQIARMAKGLTATAPQEALGSEPGTS